MKKYVLVRSGDAGVFFGELKERDRFNCLVVLNNCRRVHYWEGAASLNQMSVDGLDTQSSRVSVVTQNHEVCGVCEVLELTDKAKEVLYSAREWKN